MSDLSSAENSPKLKEKLLHQSSPEATLLADSLLDPSSEISGSASVEDLISEAAANELTHKPEAHSSPEKGNMEFSKWVETNKLSQEIVSRLQGEDLTDMETLKGLSVEDIKELKLPPDNDALLISAVHNLNIENDDSELGLWADQVGVDTETIQKFKGGGFDGIEKLKKANEDDLKRLDIKLGQRKKLVKGIAELNDTEFTRFLKEKEIKYETIAKLIKHDYDSKKTFMLMGHEQVERLDVVDAQQLLLLDVIQKMNEEEPEINQIRYEEAFAQFLSELPLEKATQTKLKKFGMDSPDALLILNKDLNSLNLSEDQRAILDDAIEELKKFLEDPDVEGQISKVVQSNRKTRTVSLAMNSVIGAYIDFVAKTKGVSKTAFANMAHYMKSVGAISEPDKITMENGMRIVKLSVKQIYEDKVVKIRKCVIGKDKSRKQPKTIMLVGATGVGKSSLINGLCNYIFDTKYEESNRFKLIDEHSDEILNAEKGQTMSQTEWITIYKIHSGDSNRLPYTLNLIDTPGFGDTRGLARDHELVEQIRSLFKTKGEHGVDSIDAVCFVAKAPDVRLTPTQRYVFSSIMSVFGKDIEENIVVMITFGDGAKPPVLDALKTAQLPYREAFKFNNSALYTNNGIAEDPKSVSSVKSSIAANASSAFGKMFWDMGVQSFDTFFEFVETLVPKSLFLTNEVLEQRRILKENLKENLYRIKDNKDFKYTVTVQFVLKLPCGPWTYVSHCMKCQETCHAKCTIKYDKRRAGCDVMNKKTGKCMSCKGKCHRKDHKNIGYVLQPKTKQIEQTWENKKKEYAEATGIVAEKKDVIEDIKAQYAHNIEKVKDYSNRCKHVLQQISQQPVKETTKSNNIYTHRRMLPNVMHTTEECLANGVNKHYSGVDQRHKVAYGTLDQLNTKKRTNSKLSDACETRQSRAKNPKKGFIPSDLGKFIGIGVYLVPYLLTLMLCCQPALTLAKPSGQINWSRDDTTCRPRLVDSTPYDDHSRQMDCGISGCNSVSKIVYEKTDMRSTTEWTPVFEWINNTHYRALDTGFDYTLQNRIDYHAFHTKHLLYINPLKLEDHGKWRSNVYDNHGEKFTSDAVNVITYDPANIEYPEEATKIVASEDSNFRLNCSASGYKPRIGWERNGEDIFDNDERYTITNRCNKTHCDGSISSKPTDTARACSNVDEYSGVYTCVISLDNTFKSKYVSPTMDVHMPYRLCQAEYLGVFAGSTFLAVTLVATIACVLLFHKKKDSKETLRRNIKYVTFGKNTKKSNNPELNSVKG